MRNPLKGIRKLLAGFSPSQHPDYTVRLSLAKSEDTPLKRLELLCNDALSEVALAAARNPAHTEESLLKLCAHPREEVRFTVAQHVNATPNVLRLLATDSIESVRREATKVLRYELLQETPAPAWPTWEAEQTFDLRPLTNERISQPAKPMEAELSPNDTNHNSERVLPRHKPPTVVEIDLIAEQEVLGEDPLAISEDALVQASVLEAAPRQHTNNEKILTEPTEGLIAEVASYKNPHLGVAGFETTEDEVSPQPLQALLTTPEKHARLDDLSNFPLEELAQGILKTVTQSSTRQIELVYQAYLESLDVKLAVKNSRSQLNKALHLLVERGNIEILDHNGKSSGYLNKTLRLPSDARTQQPTSAATRSTAPLSPLGLDAAEPNASVDLLIEMLLEERTNLPMPPISPTFEGRSNLTHQVSDSHPVKHEIPGLQPLSFEKTSNRAKSQVGDGQRELPFDALLKHGPQPRIPTDQNERRDSANPTGFRPHPRQVGDSIKEDLLRVPVAPVGPDKPLPLQPTISTPHHADNELVNLTSVQGKSESEFLTDPIHRAATPAFDDFSLLLEERTAFQPPVATAGEDTLALYLYAVPPVASPPPTTAIEDGFTLYDRAERIAAELIAAYDLDPNTLAAFADIFEVKSVGQVRIVIERLLHSGATEDEIQLCHALKQIWHDNTHYNLAWRYSQKRRGWYCLESYRTISWSVALQIIQGFGGYPDVEEVAAVLDEQFCVWQTTRSYGDHSSFVSYLLALTETCDLAFDWNFRAQPRREWAW